MRIIWRNLETECIFPLVPVSLFGGSYDHIETGEILLIAEIYFGYVFWQIEVGHFLVEAD